MEQAVLFSSSPARQSGAPSHKRLVEMQEPSEQPNWSGPQVTATDEVTETSQPHKGSFYSPGFTSAWTGSFICARGTIIVSITHSACRDTLVVGTLELRWCTHASTTNQTTVWKPDFLLVNSSGIPGQNAPPLITQVPTIVVSITAVEIKDAASSRAQEFPSVTNHAAVCTTDWDYSDSSAPPPVVAAVLAC